jgi:hypothetical protein
MTDDLSAPLARPCFYCGKDVDPNSRFTWHGVKGWERPGRKGGSDIAAREKIEDVFACDPCVRLVQAGRVPGQASLL